MSGTKITILLLIAALLISGTIFFVKKGIPAIKRKKLSEGLSEFAKKQGLNMSAADIKEKLKKADNKEIDILIDFAKKLQNKQLLEAAALMPKVNPILKKTELLQIAS